MFLNETWEWNLKGKPPQISNSNSSTKAFFDSCMYLIIKSLQINIHLKKNNPLFTFFLIHHALNIKKGSK